MKGQKVCDSKWPTWQVPEIKKRSKNNAKNHAGTLEGIDDIETELRKGSKLTKRHSVVPSTPRRCP